MQDKISHKIAGGMLAIFIVIGLLLGLSVIEAWVLKFAYNYIVVDSLMISAVKLTFWPAFVGVLVLNLIAGKFKTIRSSK